nr:MAG TPA: hypothetical protein [Caudoviricetes sp.]
MIIRAIASSKLSLQLRFTRKSAHRAEETCVYRLGVRL